MKVYIGYGSTLFISKFNEEFEVSQKFTNILANDDGCVNRPVEFLETGLCTKNEPDAWLPDITLSNNTDEANPPEVNGIHIGGNHGHPCAIQVLATNHNKTCKDVGAVYVDDAGIKYHLTTVENKDMLQIVSFNVGKSKDAYKFITTITGNLTYVENGRDNSTIKPEKQLLKYLTPAIRHTRRDLFIIKDGVKSRVLGYAEGDYAEIHEHYYVINPATVGPALYENRPKNGYTRMPIISEYGEEMISYTLKYLVLDDGTILTDFDAKRLTGVVFNSLFGAMSQARKNLLGGGIYRYYPKVLPMQNEKGLCDFTYPIDITSVYPNDKLPKRKDLTKEYWANPDSPPDRFIDYIRDKNGDNKIGYAIGYLPIYDGEPSVRKNNITYAIHIRDTLKLYPNFKDGNIESAKGVAYKKYFPITNPNAPYYTITFDGIRYIYCDFFANESLSFDLTGKIELLEKSDGTCYSVENGKLIVSANATKPEYAVFKEIL